MKIRPARASDSAAIAAIWQPVLRDTTLSFGRAQISAPQVAQMRADALAAGRCFLVAGDAAQIVGFATYRPFRAGPGYAHSMEHSVILAPSARGAGIGRALMDALETHARNAGVHVMIAAISGENPGGIAFHAALGYQPVGILPELGHKFARWLDLHLMQKIL